MSYERMLKDFHTKYGHFVAPHPTTGIPQSTKRLRIELINEEIRETKIAMVTDHLEQIADGIADSIYVLVGTAVSYGIPIDRIFIEVHRSNMTKTAAIAVDGQKYGTKTPKGPSYIPPDIKGILENPTQLTQLERMNHDTETVS